MTLVIDGRWDGAYGIGRVSREIRRHLDRSGARTYTSRFNPLSPPGVLELWIKTGLRPGTTFYSPGFTGTFPSRTRQILTIWDLVHLDPRVRSATRSAYYGAIARPAILRSGAVMTGSRTTVDAIRQWLGHRGDTVDIGVTGCGISKAFVPPVATKPKRRQVLLVSNLQPHKNVATVLSALAMTTPDIGATWVTTDCDSAQAAVRAVGIQQRMTLVSKISDADLASLYQDSVCLVFPSLSEGFGLPPIESMACGTPVLFSEGCATVRESCGFDTANRSIGDATEPEAWAAAIQDAVDNPRGITKFKSADYTWRAVAERVANFLTQVGVTGVLPDGSL